MNFYAASVAVLWSTAMRATAPVRPPRANLLRSARDAVAPLTDAYWDRATRLGRHHGDAVCGRADLDLRR